MKSEKVENQKSRNLDKVGNKKKLKTRKGDKKNDQDKLGHGLDLWSCSYSLTDNFPPNLHNA